MSTRRSYPQEAQINGELYHYERVLKDDFFSVNLLYRNACGDGYVLKLSDFRFVGGFLLRPLACLISRHEYRVYQRLADIPGIPTLGPRWGRRGYYHRFIEGKTLHEMTAADFMPTDFFEQLRELIEQVHARKVLYVDLNKLGNVILSNDGRAYLIDFQISVAFAERKGSWGHLSDRIFNRLIQEDLYHLYKHKKTFQPQRMTSDELLLAKRSKLNEWYRRWVGGPYLRVKRLIYPHGSNEIVWYKWKKVKDKTVQMP